MDRRRSSDRTLVAGLLALVLFAWPVAALERCAELPADAGSAGMATPLPAAWDAAVSRSDLKTRTAWAPRLPAALAAVAYDGTPPRGECCVGLAASRAGSQASSCPIYLKNCSFLC